MKVWACFVLSYQNLGSSVFTFLFWSLLLVWPDRFWDVQFLQWWKRMHLPFCDGSDQLTVMHPHTRTPTLRFSPSLTYSLPVSPWQTHTHYTQEKGNTVKNFLFTTQSVIHRAVISRRKNIIKNNPLHQHTALYISHSPPKKQQQQQQQPPPSCSFAKMADKTMVHITDGSHPPPTPSPPPPTSCWLKWLEKPPSIETTEAIPHPPPTPRLAHWLKSKTYANVVHKTDGNYLHLTPAHWYRHTCTPALRYFPTFSPSLSPLFTQCLLPPLPPPPHPHPPPTFFLSPFSFIIFLSCTHLGEEAIDLFLLAFFAAICSFFLFLFLMPLWAWNKVKVIKTAFLIIFFRNG